MTLENFCSDHVLKGDRTKYRYWCLLVTQDKVRDTNHGGTSASMVTTTLLPRLGLQ